MTHVFQADAHDEVRPLAATTDTGIRTAIHLLESARVLRRPDDVRRNLLLARSALYDAIKMLEQPV